MDELGSGTDPAEGMGIAVAIPDEWKKSGALYLVTTYYPEVKQYAEREEGIVNARMTFDKESLKPLYNLVIGEAGESCAFYIARRLGMPVSMLRRAAEEAYGQGGDKTGRDEKECIAKLLLESGLQENSADATYDDIKKEYVPKIQKKKVRVNNQAEADKFVLGDCVMVYPDKKIGIVCQTADNKGVLRVQLPGKKIWINHKRVKLVAPAEELYPEDYDFSIIFDSVENRKLRHQMERKFVPDCEIKIEE